MTAPSPPVPFRVRSETDVLALVPFTFGFHPHRSLVLIMVSSPGRPFSARVDLPDDPADLEEVVAELATAAERNGGGARTCALVVVYTDEHELAELASCLLTVELEALGTDVVVAIRADRNRWYRLGGEDVDGQGGEGVAYDITGHQLAARSVVDGRVLFASREELAASLDLGDPAHAQRVAAAHAALTPSTAASPSAVLAEERWLAAHLGSWLAQPPLAPAILAQLLRDVADPPLRDLVWGRMTRENAADHVRLWTSVVRHSPPALVAPAAGLLAFAAWLSGDGALAWCAVERSRAADPDHQLARLVARVLEGAVPPWEWTPPLDVLSRCAKVTGRRGP